MGTRGRTLAWGVIGASTIADEAIIPAIKAAGGVVRTLYSRDAQRGRDLAARHNIEVALTDLDAMLDVPGLEAVFVGTTNERHHAEVLAAAAAGKHILCEKPIALTTADAIEMIAAADAASVVLAVNHQQREQAVVRALRATVRSGRLGAIRAARFAHAGRLRDDLRTWRVHDRAAGAGVEFDLTVHNADLMRFLLEREVDELVALASAEADAAADTHVMATLRLDDGLLVGFHEAFDVPYAQPCVEIHGELASAVCVGHTAQQGAGRLWLTRDQGATREPIDPGPLGNPYVGVIRAFTASVELGTPPSADGVDGLRALEIALAIAEAAASGSVIALSNTV